MVQARLRGLKSRLSSVGFKEPKIQTNLHLRNIETMRQQLVDVERQQKAKGIGMFPEASKLFEKKKAVLAFAKNGVLVRR